MLKKYKTLIPIGFVLKDLGPSQMAYTCITNLNQWLENDYGIDPVLFFEEQSIPCVQPNCARYNIYDASYYYGNLITTDIKTTESAKNARVSKKFFYIYELEYIKNQENKSKFDKIMNDTSIVKFTRCLDYLDKLTKDGYNVSPIIVEDFDLNQIKKIIKGIE